jgi:acyl dehydratase
MRNSEAIEDERVPGAQMSLNEMSLLVGTELGVSTWLMIDQERINQFAACTDDRQWIHVDVKRARSESPFGTTIAHGFLTLSMLAPTSTEVWIECLGTTTLNYGVERVRFINPVRAGARIRNRIKLLAVDERPSGILVTTKNTIEIEGEEKPALVATTLTMVTVDRRSR